jgi:CRP-like cAMP-binding protein
MVPILESLPIITQKRIAHLLRPQVYAPRDNPIIYNVGDIGWDLFFIFSGFVSIQLPDDATELDATSRANWTMNKHKFDSTGLILGPGSHVGESCLCSNSGVRQETVMAATKVEIYALCKDDFDVLCRVMGSSKGNALKESLLTRTVVTGDAVDETDQTIDYTPRRVKQRSANRGSLFGRSNNSQSDKTITIRRRRLSVPGGFNGNNKSYS